MSQHEMIIMQQKIYEVISLIRYGIKKLGSKIIILYCLKLLSNHKKFMR